MQNWTSTAPNAEMLRAELWSRLHE